VSRYTTFYVTGHDYKQLSTQQQRRVAFEDNDVLKEARGVRQLLAIGGLKSVQVTHAYNLKRGKAEVNGFEAFLKERLEPRRADTSQAGDDDAAKMLNVKVDELTAWLDKMMKR
jgi:hypothetical protein